MVCTINSVSSKSAPKWQFSNFCFIIVVCVLHCIRMLANSVLHNGGNDLTAQDMGTFRLRYLCLPNSHGVLLQQMNGDSVLDESAVRQLLLLLSS